MYSDLVSPVFVGRDAELATLTRRWSGGRRGPCGRAPRRRGRGGQDAARRRGGRAGACDAVRESLRAAASRWAARGCRSARSRTRSAAHARHVPRGARRAARARRGSEFAHVLPDLDPDSALSIAPAEPRAARRACSSWSLGVIERLAADRPLMFVIEDLHWADRSTLDLVALLVRALRAARVLVVVSFRTDELHRSHPLRPLVTGWERVRTVQRIELERFGPRTSRSSSRPSSARRRARGWSTWSTSARRATRSSSRRSSARSRAAPTPTSCRCPCATSSWPASSALDPAAQRLLRIAAAAGRAVSDRLLAAVAGVGDASSTLRCARPSSTTCSCPTGPTAATCSAMR